MTEMLESFRGIAPTIHLAAGPLDPPAAKRVMYALILTKRRKKLSKKSSNLVAKSVWNYAWYWHVAAIFTPEVTKKCCPNNIALQKF